MAEFKSKYNIGDFVYLRTDTLQSKSLIIAVTFSPSGVMYNVVSGTIAYDAFEIELSSEKDASFTLGLE